MNSPLNAEIIRDIRQLLDRECIPQAEIARKLQCSPQRLSYNLCYKLNIPFLEHIAKAMGYRISIKWIKEKETTF